MSKSKLIIDPLVWYADYDEFHNIIFSAFAPYEEMLEYRFEPRVVNGEKVYINMSSPELVPEGDEKLTWKTPEEAKTYFEKSNLEMLDFWHNNPVNNEEELDEGEEAYKEHTDFTQ